jgi:hypothetical protein
MALRNSKNVYFWWNYDLGKFEGSFSQACIVAQWVGRSLANPVVVGSSPRLRKLFFFYNKCLNG